MAIAIDGQLFPDKPHCTTCICGRRAPIQGNWELNKGPGTISWQEFMLAFNRYRARYGGDIVDADRLCARGGFDYKELFDLLGHAPTTWDPR